MFSDLPVSIDLLCLLALALWSVPLNHIPAIPRVVLAGVEWGLGNRDKSPDVPHE